MMPSAPPIAPPALLRKLRVLAVNDALNPASGAPVPSPCVSVCRMDTDNQYCVGCLRTLEELRVWGSASDATKRDIWQAVRTRSQAHA